MYLKSVEKTWCSGYKLILMDLNMPVMNGLQSSNKILEYDTKKPKPKIVAVTAFASDVERQKCFAIGMSDFYLKPISFEAYKGILSDIDK